MSLIMTVERQHMKIYLSFLMHDTMNANTRQWGGDEAMLKEKKKNRKALHIEVK